jgi:hypothetical protein
METWLPVGLILLGGTLVGLAPKANRKTMRFGWVLMGAGIVASGIMLFT